MRSEPKTASQQCPYRLRDIGLPIPVFVALDVIVTKISHDKRPRRAPDQLHLEAVVVAHLSSLLAEH